MLNILVKRNLVLLYLLFFFFGLTSQLQAQIQDIQDILILVFTGVRADMDEKDMHTNVVDVNIQFSGYYRVVPLILYNSGDEQKNESFYITVVSKNGIVSTPIDSNTGPYKVILDDPGPKHTAWRDAGLFYFYDDISTIKMHHYASIMDQYPQFLNGPISGPESVKIADSLKLVSEPIVDGALELRATTLHFETIGEQKRGLAYPGESVGYKIFIRNQYQNLIRSAKLNNQLPSSLTIEKFFNSPSEFDGEKIVWDLPHIQPGDSVVISFIAILPEVMPYGLMPLIDKAEIIVPNDLDTSNNYAVSTIYALTDSNGTRPNSADLSISLKSITDSVLVLDGDSINIVKPGDYVEYRLNVTNHGPDFVRDIVVTNIVSPYLKVENTSLEPDYIYGDSLLWGFKSLAPDSSMQILYSGEISISIPEKDSLVIAKALAIAKNDTTEHNNIAIDTVFVKSTIVLKPMIEAWPSLVDVTDSIRIRVQIQVNTARWDLWIYLPDGKIVKNFADEFIATTTLIPDVWYEINEAYRPLRLISSSKEEQLIFEIRTRDILGLEVSAQATVLVQSSNYLVLDRNVFKPEIDNPLGIRFKLSYRRKAKLDVYDISGRQIVNLAEDVFEGGWNTYTWNGISSKGQKIGSGVYLVTLRAGEFNSWKKFLIIR